MARLSVPGGAPNWAARRRTDDRLRAVDVAPRVGRWGSLPTPTCRTRRPGVPPVALRPAPTMQHYDPEAIDYWVSQAGAASGDR